MLWCEEICRNVQSLTMCEILSVGLVLTGTCTASKISQILVVMVRTLKELVWSELHFLYAMLLNAAVAHQAADH